MIEPRRRLFFKTRRRTLSLCVAAGVVLTAMVTVSFDPDSPYDAAVRALPQCDSAAARRAIRSNLADRGTSNEKVEIAAITAVRSERDRPMAVCEADVEIRGQVRSVEFEIVPRVAEPSYEIRFSPT